MPELPEVETVARQLATAVLRRTVKRVETLDPKLRGSALARLNDYQIGAVKRVGKQVVFSLNRGRQNNLHLAVHLRMSGRLVWCRSHTKVAAGDAKHVRARLTLNGGELLFIDPRRFGTMVISPEIARFDPKGVEPLAPAFTETVLGALLKKSSQNIKTWLLRQDKLVGIGNIYASEILFDCKISPRRKAGKIRRSEIPALYRSIRKILNKAIDNCGTTFSDFQDANGVTGSYGRFLKVYEREGAPCRRCKATHQILRITQQQRSTYFCPKCQR